ncbi:Hypothetical protein, putative [Bodo saltans]|uniref:Uncharacterized protein n=1 Tax=Bodo saltans TaxID=75058 RepID=A0A0S4IS89_BODSA|nr:Hypothetical protein, putative [Bodo saltans]|eukprot:CUF62297.1 Hypothetical protein, putative [Bodo saltans]
MAGGLITKLVQTNGSSNVTSGGTIQTLVGCGNMSISGNVSSVETTTSMATVRIDGAVDYITISSPLATILLLPTGTIGMIGYTASGIRGASFQLYGAVSSMTTSNGSIHVYQGCKVTFHRWDNNGAIVVYLGGWVGDSFGFGSAVVAGYVETMTTIQPSTISILLGGHINGITILSSGTNVTVHGTAGVIDAGSYYPSIEITGSVLNTTAGFTLGER